MCICRQTIHYGICNCRFVDVIIPLSDRQLRSDYDRFSLIKVFQREDQGTGLILVCLVNLKYSRKGSNSSSEHVGKQFYTSEDDSHSILLI